MTDTYTQTQGSEASEASEFPPYVHTQETTGQSPQPTPFRTFMTSGIKKQIAFYARLYEEMDIEDDSRRAASFHECRSSAWFVRHKLTHEVRVASQRCNLRWCPLCIKTKRFVMKSSVIPWVKKVRKPKFLTLTLKHSADPLADQLDRIYDCLKKLRKSVLWKKHIKGGLWFFQVTLSDKTNQWHPHIHIICEGAYLPHQQIKAKWLEITKDSNIIDIRAVRDAKKTAEYVARYATAPADLTTLKMEEAKEVFRALKGRRMCGTFGTGKDIQLVPKKCPEADDWEYVADFKTIAEGRFRETNFAEIWIAWTLKKPCHVETAEPPPPTFTNDEHLEFEPENYKQLSFQWNTNFFKNGQKDDIPF